MRQLLLSLATIVAALVSGAPTARAESFSITSYWVTADGSNYDWTFNVAVSGGTFGILDTIGIVVPSEVTAFSGPSGWINIVGAPLWTYTSMGTSSTGTFEVKSNVDTGTAIVTFADVDLPNVKLSASVDPSGGGTSMPEPGFAFYVTLGFGLLGIVLSRYRFSKSASWKTSPS